VDELGGAHGETAMLDGMVIKQGTQGTTTTKRSDRAALARRLLDRAGATYAEQAGIRLVDKPAALYQLLVLAQLLSTRISAEVALAAARELHAEGLTTAAKMATAKRSSVIGALGRARYKRYDEITATRLGESAQCVLDWYGGDLRRLSEAAQRDVDAASPLLQEFPGIGPVGSRIFLREVQHVWVWVRPYADVRVITAANELGLPHTIPELVRLAGTKDLAAMSAALVHVSLDRRTREAVLTH
jgi:endonuclease III